ncbi:MAG TPA: DUF2911 domain-containing protein [Thermoanaerobaculia bacterium]|nr:DUF2911 domain-containing protein [Thermoanaerobaculia bacterium]
MSRSATLAVLAAAAAPALAQLTTPLPSPNATVSQTIGVTKVEVVYSRPHVKGPTRKEERVIWGGLVPYDQVWRTGANAVTRITFDGDVSVEGQKLAAGSYGLYTIPGKTEWTVIFSKVSTGGPDYKAENDALRVKVKPVPTEMHEIFTILFPMVTSDSAVLALLWEKLAVGVGIVVDTKAQFLANAKDAVAKAKADDWQTPLAAARYLYDNKYALDDAARWLDKSIAAKATFGNLSTKANALAAEGKTKDAIATAEKALAAGKAAEQKPSPEAVAALEKKIAEWGK